MYIVTGGAGFIGSNLVRGLNRRGISDVLVVDDLEQGDKHRTLNALEFLVLVDYRDFLEQLDGVPIHLISTHYYDEKEFAKSGIPAVRDRLYQILSTSQRFEHSRKILSDRLTIVVHRLLD